MRVGAMVAALVRKLVVLAVPREKLRMRTIRLALRRKQLTARINDRLHPFNVIHFAMNDDVETIRKSNQTPVEHPVCRAR